MGVVTSAAPHLSEFEVSVRLKQTAGREHKRWLKIRNALVDPRAASEIALHADVSILAFITWCLGTTDSVHQPSKAMSTVCGAEVIWKKDEEAEFLKPFLDIAPTGEICVAGPIKEAVEAGKCHPQFDSETPGNFHAV